MSDVDQVRSAADIVKIVGDYVKLRKAGVNLIGLCPFHQEKTPSFAVHPTKQIFHCFGCGVGGDVFKFLMLIENLSFPEALRRVAEKVGVQIEDRGTTFDANACERAVLGKIHEVAAKFFATQLGATSEGRAARAYLTDRGLSDEVVALFRLGYAPSDGQALYRHLAEAGFEAADLEKSGLVLKDATSNRRFDRFRRRVIFPIARETGKIVAFGARSLGDEEPKYLNSPETPIYTKSRTLYHLDRAAPAIRKLDFAVLVEGYMDTIAVASAGIQNVVASCGTSLTESQVRLLGRYSRRIVVNYDPDSAGMAATERSLSLLLEEGFECKVLALAGGLDPDSFVRKHGAGVYQDKLTSAPSYLDYLTERAAHAHDLTSAEGKVAAANAVMPHLAQVPNPMLRAEFAGRLAERLRLDEGLLRDELRRAARRGRGQIKERPESAVVREATPVEKDLVRAFLSSRDLADEFLPALVEEGCFQGLVAERVFAQFLELQRRGERIEPGLLDGTLTAEEQRLVRECQFSETPDRERVRSACVALQRRRAERERDRLQGAIQAAERARDAARLAELLSAKSLIAKKLSELKATSAAQARN